MPFDECFSGAARISSGLRTPPCSSESSTVLLEGALHGLACEVLLNSGFRAMAMGEFQAARSPPWL